MNYRTSELSFHWKPEDYKEVNLTFTIDEDAELGTLCECFKAFCFAIGYPVQHMSEYFEEDDA